MDASRYVVCLWPGLPELWFRGRWSGLAPAVMFTVAFNFLVVARFVYPEWLVPSLVRIACWVGVGVWMMMVVRASGRLPALLYPRAVAEVADRFPDARDHFLRGQWAESEAILAECLQTDPRDCQSLLMLACVYRHTGRYEAASGTLGQLGRLETADPWWLECQAERRRLAQAMEPAEQPPERPAEQSGSQPAGQTAAPPIPDD